MTDWTQLARGIDVSRWQGEIDWSDPELKPVQFAIVKLVDGLGAAARADEHLAGVRGTTILPGVYGLWQWEDPPWDQATALVDAIPEWYGAGCLPPALDVETCEMDAAIDAGVSALDIATEWAEWAEAIGRQLGARPLLYISPRGVRHLRRCRSWTAWADGLLPRLFDLWLCDYDAVRDDYPAPHESPGPISPWGSWTIWQYTSALDGRAHGARSRRLDGDLHSGSARELYRWAREAWA